MQEQKPTEKPLLSQKPRQPEFEEIKVEPVDDILAELHAVREEPQDGLSMQYQTLMNGMKVPISQYEYERPCRYGCYCEPCRHGFCGQCDVENPKNSGDFFLRRRAYRGW